MSNSFLLTLALESLPGTQLTSEEYLEYYSTLDMIFCMIRDDELYIYVYEKP